MKILFAAICIIVINTSCNDQSGNLLIHSETGMSFQIKEIDNMVIVSTRINTGKLSVKDRSSTTYHFNSNNSNTYFIGNSKDTIRSLDVHMERYYGAAPYDVVNFYFPSEALKSKELVVNEPIISTQKIQLDLNNLKL